MLLLWCRRLVWKLSKRLLRPTTEWLLRLRRDLTSNGVSLLLARKLAKRLLRRLLPLLTCRRHHVR